MLNVYGNVDTKLLEALALVKGNPGILMAKAFLDGINFNIPSWHYNELYKMAAEVVEG